MVLALLFYDGESAARRVTILVHDQPALHRSLLEAAGGVVRAARPGIHRSFPQRGRDGSRHAARQGGHAALPPPAGPWDRHAHRAEPGVHHHQAVQQRGQPVRPGASSRRPTVVLAGSSPSRGRSGTATGSTS
jgi:hypothetical protein